MMMKLFCKLLILVLCCNVLMAQDKNQILKLDSNSFTQLLVNNPAYVNKELWEFFYQKAEQEFESESYQSALFISEKAKILADKLNDLMIIYRSYRQLAKIEIKLSNNQKAGELIQKAFDSFRDEQKKIAPAKIELETEDGYLYYYWALIYSSPDYTNTRLDIAFRYLALAHAFNSFYAEPKFDDPYVTTSLHIARCFGMNGNQIAKLLWIENAKLRLSDSSKNRNKLLFEIYYESQDAYQNLGDYSSANKELLKIQNLPIISTKSNLLYLRAMADFHSGLNNRKKQGDFFNQGIKLAQKSNNQGQLADFYSGQMLRHMNKKSFDEATEFLKLLRKIDKQFVNRLDLVVTEAVLAARNGDFEKSNSLLVESEKVLNEMGKDWRNEIFLRSWQSEILLLGKNYEKLKLVTDRYLEIVINNGFSDYLPEVYIYRAKAFIGLGKNQEAKEAVEELVNQIELKRKSESANISTGIMEGVFEAYQLQTDLHLAENKIAEAFQSSESLKGRWLNEKIAGNPLKQKVFLDPKLKSEIFDVTQQILKNPKDEQLFAKLSELEKKAIFYEGSDQQNNEFLKSSNNLLSELEKSPIDNQTAIVSYTFTNEGKLVAFVWERGKELLVKQLPISKAEIDILAKGIQEKIKNLIFFKNEGNQIYDKLLKPLNLHAKHLIIIPDKGLWKIPFQALSEDGKTYLIENKTVSYAPSVSILLNQLNNPPPKRQTFQAFSNSRFNTIFLKYVDAEASALAKLYGVQPNLSSTKSQFTGLSEKSDILHFSMHAEVDNDEPFNSFIGFKPVGKDDGRLTVDDLLKIKLKKGSLIFLASCDTNKVFNGEGLISLAWGMMGAGATTVISTQWEANDKSTAIFTKTFYKHYKQGSSPAESMQKAALELIKNKSNNMHEPYFWADFMLNGDFR